jgi:hypothetical protein
VISPSELAGPTPQMPLPTTATRTLCFGYILRVLVLQPAIKNCGVLLWSAMHSCVMERCNTAQAESASSGVARCISIVHPHQISSKISFALKPCNSQRPQSSNDKKRIVACSYCTVSRRTSSLPECRRKGRKISPVGAGVTFDVVGWLDSGQPPEMWRCIHKRAKTEINTGR